MTARPRPDHPLELRKASCSPSAPAKQKGAHIAPPTDCRAKRTPSPTAPGSGRKQTQYESETPLDGLRFADKASRIFVRTTARAFRIVESSRNPSFPARPRSVKPQRISRLPNHFGNPAALRSLVDVAVRRQVLRQSVSPPDAICPNAGRGEGTGHKGSRNQRRGAASDSPQERQAPIQFAGRRNRVMAPNSLILHDSCALGPSDEDGCERPQSITAALRMQTIVACAGFPLRLRMR